MSKHWKVYDHPSDLGLEARADSLAGLFEALGEGLAEQVCPRRQVRPAGTRRIAVRADDVESLLVEFLVQLHRLFALERFLIAQVAVVRMNESSLEAEVAGETYDRSRHELGPEIKAVTYHQLKVAREGDHWTGRVLLDL